MVGYGAYLIFRKSEGGDYSFDLSPLLGVIIILFAFLVFGGIFLW